MAILAVAAAAPSLRGQALIIEPFDGAWVADPDGDSTRFLPAGTSTGICEAAQADEAALTHYWSRFDDSLYPLTHSAPYCAGLLVERR